MFNLGNWIPLEGDKGTVYLGIHILHFRKKIFHKTNFKAISDSETNNEKKKLTAHYSFTTFLLITP